ncbi:MAG: hypothetical protein ACREMY_03165, partial [bacterium]
TDARGFRNYRDGCLESFRDALLGELATQERELEDAAGAADEEGASDTPSSGGSQPDEPRRRNRWMRVIIPSAAGAVVVVAVVLGLVLWPRSSPSGSNHQSGTSTQTVSTAVSTGRTRTELSGSGGAKTYRDPHNQSETGPGVPSYTQVKVLCRVYVPTPPSVVPDGYWYQLASGRWNGYYAPANSFMNGDKIGGPTEHNTDFAVPVCDHT